MARGVWLAGGIENGYPWLSLWFGAPHGVAGFVVLYASLLILLHVTVVWLLRAIFRDARIAPRSILLGISHYSDMTGAAWRRYFCEPWHALYDLLSLSGFLYLLTHLGNWASPIYPGEDGWRAVAIVMLVVQFVILVTRRYRPREYRR